MAKKITENAPKAVKAKSKETKEPKKQPLTLLQAMDTVAEKSRHSKMTATFMKSVAAETALIAESYGITEQQAVILAACMAVGPNRVDMDDLSHFLELSPIRVLKYGSDVETLKRMRLLREERFCSDYQFSVATPVITGLMRNEAYHKPERVGLDVCEFFDALEEMYEDLDNNITTPEVLYEDIKALLKDNAELDFVKQVIQQNLTDQNELLLFMLFCHLRVNREDDAVNFRDMSNIFRNNRRDFKAAKHGFSCGEHSLIMRGLVERNCDMGQASLNSFKLTDMVKNTMLAELNLSRGEANVSNLIKPNDLPGKELFYSKRVGRQVSELTSFLRPEQYAEIHNRLEERGFRQGFACLFYGGPGTGKTETVYQLAKATGRSIMLVDVSQIKSKWVGESEQNVKAVFDRYREAVRRQELAPILFFNEADALFNTRMNGARRSVDKMENSMQNIILQEMEQLDGILIATTNLEGNLDKAFERRFLYKIRFDKPDEEVRAKIWRTMIKELGERDARQLAASFDLSGGQIENVARKYSITSVLHGDSADLLSELTSYCREERLSSTPIKRNVGFV